MISLFDIAPKDQSITYLTQIFGAVGNVLPIGDSTGLILSVLFRWFNTMALTLGTLMVVYITVVGVLQTAHEGEFMGKKWNGLWVPIRMVFGIVALFPTATGYCALQIVMMWIITQGIGVADTLWTKALVVASQTGSPYGKADTTAAIALQGKTGSINLLFNALLCQATAASTADGIMPGTTNNIYYCKDNPTAPFCRPASSILDTTLSNQNGGQVTEDATSHSYRMGPNGACGTLIFARCEGPDTSLPCNTTNNPDAANSLQCLTCKAKAATLQSIVSVLGNIAASIVNADSSYYQFYYARSTTAPTWITSYCSSLNISSSHCCTKSIDPNCAPATSFQDPGTNNMPSPGWPVLVKYSLQPSLSDIDFINAAIKEYVAGVMVGPYTTWLSMQGTQALGEWQKNASDTGWILAGAYYFKLLKGDTKTLPSPDTSNPFTVQPSQTPPTQSGNDLYPYRNHYTTGTDIIDTISSARQNTLSPSGAPAGVDSASSALNSAASGIVNDFMNQMTPNDKNPILSIATYGKHLMMIAQVTFASLVTVVSVVTAVTTINVIALGSGMTSTPWGEAWKAIVGVLGPFVGILLGAIFALGATLGIYVPLIPYILFTMGAIGWMIATIEAMVACPLIALGILSPAGQHELLGRAEPAVMLIFNLFLRPGLMVIGMIASMLLIIPVANLINSGFKAIMGDIMSDPGLFELCLFIAAYCSIVVSAMNKVFSLIHVIPERVLTWIGGQAVQYGETEALGEAKRSVEGGAQATTGGAKGTAQAAEAAGDRRSQKKAYDKAQEAKDNTDAGAATNQNQSGGGTPPPNLG